MVNMTSLKFLNGICIFYNVRSLREGIKTGMFLALVAKEVQSDSSIVDVPLEVKNLLDDFVDMVSDEFPSELPPLRDNQHATDLVRVLNCLTFHIIG